MRDYDSGSQKCVNMEEERVLYRDAENMAMWSAHAVTHRSPLYGCWATAVKNYINEKPNCVLYLLEDLQYRNSTTFLAAGTDKEYAD